MALYAIGDREPTIDPSAFVHPDATVIGDVRIGAEASVWPQAVIRGDYGTITIGARTSIQDGTVIHATADLPTVIGEGCVIGHLAHLEGCTIHNGALIGSQSVVLHNAVVHSGALVGACALVPNKMVVPARAMALGVPCTIKPDAVMDGLIELNAAVYVANTAWYKTDLRRID